MSNPNNIDPLEGKGEEMIPEKGLPFDDIDETPLEDIPPEERIPDFPQVDPTQPQKETTPDEDTNADEEPKFELTDAETEAFVGDGVDAFDLESSPWTMDDEEVETFLGESSEVFTPSDEFNMPFEEKDHSETEEIAPTGEEFNIPPDDHGDEGMSTHREDSPEDKGGEHHHETPFVANVHQPPGPAISKPAHTHDDIHHAGQAAAKPIVDLLVSDDAMEALWRRAAQAQKDVNRHIQTVYIAQPLLDQIQAGRNELMAGKEFYDDAERHIAEVEYRIQHSIQLEKWSKTLIPRLFVYLAIWFSGLVVAIFLIGENIFAPETSALISLAGSMIWGGIGGILGALLPLIKHFSEEQDFANRHTWWYISSPFTGVAMGAIIYLFMSAGVLSITAGANVITSPIIVYILAGLAGYQHNVFTDLVKRMLKVLEVEKKDKAEPPPTPETPPPTDEA